MSNNTVTVLLQRMRGGNSSARDELMSLVYPELLRIARRQLRRERAGHVLQSAALVHEMFLRIADQKQAQWQDRAPFLAVSGQIMRRMHARVGAGSAAAPRLRFSLTPTSTWRRRLGST